MAMDPRRASQREKSLRKDSLRKRDFGLMIMSGQRAELGKKASGSGKQCAERWPAGSWVRLNGGQGCNQSTMVERASLQLLEVPSDKRC